MALVTTHKAILHEIDKCAKCRGCQVACERSKGLPVPKDTVGNYVIDGVPSIAWDDPMLVKSQSENDLPPYVRYSCWHCDGPPCVSACPLGALKIDANSGAVYVDEVLCKPDRFPCSRQCAKLCRKGGYIRIRPSDSAIGQSALAIKCDMCWNRVASQGGKPACVATCPNNALTYGDKSVIHAKALTFKYASGSEGHIYWVSNKNNFTPPVSDSHGGYQSSSILSKSMSASANKMLTVPTLMVGGLYALYQRRIDLKEDE